MVLKLPNEKYRSHQVDNTDIIKVTPRSIQSLTGVLNFAFKVKAPGRAFCLDATSGVLKQHNKIRVTRDIRQTYMCKSFLRTTME